MPAERVIPEAWLPALPESRQPFRVIVHWTAGHYKPSLLDRSHYHLLIDGDGHAVRGMLPIGKYGPPWHTRGLNSRSVGLSLCAMAGAVESPFKPGPAPLTKVQWERACQAIAEILDAYNLALNERTVLCHSEVTRTYDILQRGKWDVDTLPFDRTLSAPEVHSQLRRKVEWYLREYAGRK